MIIGSGFAGLLAAYIFPRETIVEAAAAPTQMHKALLRFRTDAASKLTGIPFKKVRVRKGIFFEGEFHQPTIQLANLYSQKCLGKILGDRSIWSIEAADRYVAPETFYEQLIEAVGPRIMWGQTIDFKLAKKCDAPFISTAPLPAVLQSLGVEVEAHFDRAAITVQRYRVQDCDCYQTIYFPTDAHSLYRASITGSLLICEFEGAPEGDWLRDLLNAFALDGDYVDEIDKVKQSYGKIAEIDTTLRKSIIHRLSVEHNIYSLGRFATWRNILLDDVIDDAWVVKRLMHQSEYDRRMAAL
jgi:hypothetical protein